ncbi:unnamed protein product [Phaedon cochleariae]|uniref:Pacifastin domain-containing protein n=1 Tax=Phaedon cochleariae TaxID=80249 RepID=A0A9N9X2H2_PHACE|nr:unnamed protein product [Phaedon cochleariae]
MWFSAFVLIFVGMCLCLSGASICQPYSTFYVDCNSCMCSGNGREYSCTNEICPPKVDYDENYDVKLTKEGYKLLVPKNDARRTLDDYSDSVLTKKRFPRVPFGYPYINDEIPPSNKESDNKFEDIDDINEETEKITNGEDDNEVVKREDPLIRRKQEDIRK